MRRLFVPLALVLLALGGCKTDYSWTSSVPREMRAVSVPTFRNESDITELGSVVADQVLREIQREGSFAIVRSPDAAVEVQGIIREASSTYAAGDRHSGMRLSEYVLRVVAEVSVIDRVNGKVLINNRKYSARTTFVMNQDRLTGERNASGRVAEDIAHQIVDDLTSMQW